jgi:hypothetical protein
VVEEGGFLLVWEGLEDRDIIRERLERRLNLEWLGGKEVKGGVGCGIRPGTIDDRYQHQRCHLHTSTLHDTSTRYGGGTATLRAWTQITQH